MSNELLRSPAVLLVDDRPANLTALEAVLAPLGVRLVRALSGAQALEIAATESLAAALLDVQMPGMDGFELARRLRAMPQARQVPIVFLTAIHRDEKYLKQGYAVGGADYLTKPFEPEILRARVKAFVDLYEQREAIRGVEVGARTRERDEALRRLSALERISTAALETDDVPSFLRELLSVFLSAADAADAAAIVLKEGETLCVQVYNGELIASEPGRPHKGVHRAPLVSNGELVGTAEIGSSTSVDFTEGECRLFVAMVEHAAWAVAKRAQREHARLELELLAKERARLLEMERLARDSAETASRLKDEFLATVSHELRNPLNAILGWAAIARRRPHDADIGRALETIERNAHAQARMIDDLIDISRVTRGQLRLEMRPTRVVDILDRTVLALQPAAMAKGVKVDVRAEDVGYVPADADRLQQVVWNLLSNAIKFTPEGGRVELTLERRHASIAIRVVDTGMGIGADFLPYLFDAFRQEHTGGARQGGLGLGLAIVKRLVEAHGGNISVASDGVGRGTTFTVELPGDSRSVTGAEGEARSHGASP